MTSLTLPACTFENETSTPPPPRSSKITSCIQTHPQIPHSLSLSHSFKPSFPSFCQKRINKGKAAAITSHIDLSLSNCVCEIWSDLMLSRLSHSFRYQYSSHTHRVKLMTSHFCLSVSRNVVCIRFCLSHALSQIILKMCHKHWESVCVSQKSVIIIF